MSHITHDKKKTLARVRRIRGQIEAVERAIDDERDCAEVLQLLASIKGAVSGLTSELIEGHINEHILHAKDQRSREQGAAELIAVIRSYMK